MVTTEQEIENGPPTTCLEKTSCDSLSISEKENIMALVTVRYSALRAVIVVGSLVCVLTALPVEAETQQTPWDCSNYEGDAQTRCVNAIIEAQQKKIAELEGKLHTQQGTVGQLQDQLDRQSTATVDLQRRLAEQSPTNLIPVPYSYNPYSYTYVPGLGFDLHFGGFGFHLSPDDDHWGHRHRGHGGRHHR